EVLGRVAREDQYLRHAIDRRRRGHGALQTEGVATRRFPIRFTGLSRAMIALGLSPSRSWVEVGDDVLRVRMSWGFSLDAPLVNVRDARPDTGRVGGWASTAGEDAGSSTGRR